MHGDSAKAVEGPAVHLSCDGVKGPAQQVCHRTLRRASLVCEFGEKRSWLLGHHGFTVLVPCILGVCLCGCSTRQLSHVHICKW